LRAFAWFPTEVSTFGRTILRLSTRVVVLGRCGVLVRKRAWGSNYFVVLESKESVSVSVLAYRIQISIDE